MEWWHRKLHLSMQNNICFHLGASMGASVTDINKDAPFVPYGTDTSLYDIVEKHTKSYSKGYWFVVSGKEYWGYVMYQSGEETRGAKNNRNVCGHWFS